MYKYTSGVALMALLGVSLTACTKEEAPTETTAQSALQCTQPAVTPAPSASQEDFDRYSWQMFIALNWPAKTGDRGQPNCDQTIAAEGTPVWQTYKTLEQTFLPNAADPGPWNAGGSDASLSRINTSVLKNTGVANFAGQAVGGWLIDQRGNPTYYTIYTNQIAYEYIVSNSFYNADIVSKAQDIKFPDNATEIKASWRMLTPEDDASRYLTMQTQVATFDESGKPTGTTSEATVGLVGLHIVTKVPGYPQRIWSTFEHVDNVPPKENIEGQWIDKPAEGIFYAYFDSEASGGNINHSSCLWQQQDDQLVCVPKEGVTITTPDPLTRVTPIATETKKVNADAQQDLAQTVLQYYQLVTTQRPVKPESEEDSLGQPTPAVAANTTLESYIQPNSSCMGCHATATPANSNHKSDFSYLFKFAQKPTAARANNE